MRINKYVAQATGLSRRKADEIIANQEVSINNQIAKLGDEIKPGDTVKHGTKLLGLKPKTITILINKPAGYVCSRRGQGSQTIYDLLPETLRHLKPAGRLDKDSSGLLLMTDDGDLAYALTHPSFQKEKVYEIELDKPLRPASRQLIEQGVELEDGPSKLKLNGKHKNWTVTMNEGRNRQIRRTFAAAGYSVTKLHRTKFGNFMLEKLEVGKFLYV
jgi:23S rRNA pseudouridine2605 synthase